MASRSQQQKIRKMKRRHRYARFSGEASKYAIRIEQSLVHVNEETTKVIEVQVPVGPISMSKQVVNTGRGPNSERMQEYYSRITAKSKQVTLWEDLGLKHSSYRQVWQETPRENRISLVNDATGRLDLFFCVKQWFFVDIDYRKKTIKRSIIYGSRDKAMSRLKEKRITWTEKIDME